jgi:hypothetical protein
MEWSQDKAILEERERYIVCVASRQGAKDWGVAYYEQGKWQPTNRPWNTGEITHWMKVKLPKE